MNVLRTVSLAYIAIPTLTFLLGMLRPLVGVPLAALVAAAVVFAVRGIRQDTAADEGRAMIVRPRTIFALVVLSIVWCVVCGQFEICAQMWDWHGRNATLRDLISHSWPVRYPRHGAAALSFYFGHWLPSALVGRAAFLVTGSLEVAWRVANICLGTWTALGVTLVWLLVLAQLRAGTVRAVAIAVLAFVLFCGTGEVLGRTFIDLKNGSENHHGPWSVLFQFTSNTELLAWVFHQTVTAWIATLLVLAGRQILPYAGLVLAFILPCGPFPAVGLGWIMAFLAVSAAVDAQKRKSFCRFLRLFATLPNFVGIFAVIPVIAAYLVTNSASGSICPAWSDVHPTAYFFKRWLLFVVCEVGLYAVFLFPGHRRDPLYWAAFTFLALCPLLKIGPSCDFCMRASIPALLVVAIMSTGTVLDSGGRRFCRIGILACLLVASHTPCIFIDRVIRETVKRRAKGASVVCDKIRTYDRDMAEIAVKSDLDRLMIQFTGHMYCKNPESTFFFKNLARRPQSVLKEYEKVDKK